MVAPELSSCIADVTVVAAEVGSSRSVTKVTGCIAVAELDTLATEEVRCIVIVTVVAPECVCVALGWPLLNPV